MERSLLRNKVQMSKWLNFNIFVIWALNLMSPSGMVEIPRLEAKLSLRNGRLVLSASSFEIGTKPTMSIWTTRHQNCHSGENRNPGVVPTKVGNHLKDWIPVSTGNPGFLLAQEWRAKERKWPKSTSSRRHVEEPLAFKARVVQFKAKVIVVCARSYKVVY